MSLTTQISSLATRVASEFKAMRSNGETLPTTGTTNYVLQKTASSRAWVPGVVSTTSATLKLHIGDTPPSSPAEDDIWIDTSGL